MRTARRIAAVAAIALVCLFIVWHVVVLHWLSVHTGTATGTGVYYAFWSGFGSDLGEATLVATMAAGVSAAYRHHNCHVKGCLRMGQPVQDTPYIACAKHHPQHESDKRGVSHETILAASRRANL